jgi:hypothetical protein
MLMNVGRISVGHPTAKDEPGEKQADVRESGFTQDRFVLLWRENVQLPVNSKSAGFSVGYWLIILNKLPLSEAVNSSHNRFLDRIRYEHRVLSGGCRDYSSHIEHLSEKLNHTPHQEEDIRDTEKYGKAEFAAGPPLSVLAECPGGV